MGHIPFVYSIATFSTMRCYEQLRDGPVLHKLPVRIVGIGGGYAYGHAGPTHYALEDLTICRAQPDLTVIAPADRAQARAALRQSLTIPGPVYFRLDKTSYPDIEGLAGRFALSTPEVVCHGEDVLFIATGSIAHEVLDAVQLLDFHGISAGLAIQAHLGTEGSESLAALLAGYRSVITVEEGYATGGLGSLVAETIAQNGLPCRLSIQGIRTITAGCSGSGSYMRRQAGLDADTLAGVAEQMLSHSSRRLAA